jgi:hypothetical protein
MMARHLRPDFSLSIGSPQIRRSQTNERRPAIVENMRNTARNVNQSSRTRILYTNSVTTDNRSNVTSSDLLYRHIRSLNASTNRLLEQMFISDEQSSLIDNELAHYINEDNETSQVRLTNVRYRRIRRTGFSNLSPSTPSTLSAPSTSSTSSISSTPSTSSTSSISSTPFTPSTSSTPFTPSSTSSIDPVTSPVFTIEDITTRDSQDDTDDNDMLLAIKLSLQNCTLHDTNESIDYTCAICLEMMLPDDHVKRLCGHRFHTKCDNQWKQRTRLMVLSGANIVKDHCALCRRT